MAAGKSGSKTIGVFAAGTSWHGATLYENSWALVVGINQYRPPIPSLKFAERDAEEVAALLPSLGFPERNIEVLLGCRERITWDRIIGCLKNLFPKMGKNDRLLFYHSGHGATALIHGEQYGYLVMPDSVVQRWPEDEKELLERAPEPSLDMQVLLSEIRSAPPKHRLLLLDSCFSGFLKNPKSATQMHFNPAQLLQWVAKPVTQVLTAGQAGQEAFEDEKSQHGIFTHYLLEGLRGGADESRDGVIAFENIHHYVFRQVTAETEGQTPQGFSTHGDGHFIFVRREVTDWPLMKRLLLEATGALAQKERTRALDKLRGAAAIDPGDNVLRDLIRQLEQCPEEPSAISAHVVLNEPRAFPNWQKADFAGFPLSGCSRFRIIFDLSAVGTYWRAGFVLAPELYLPGDADNTIERYFLFHIGCSHLQIPPRILEERKTLHYKAYAHQSELHPHVEFDWSDRFIELDVRLNSSPASVAIRFGGLTKEYQCDPSFFRFVYLLAWADGEMPFHIPARVEFLEEGAKEIRYLPGQGSELPDAFRVAVERSNKKGATVAMALGPVEKVSDRGEAQHFVTEEPYRCVIARRAGSALAYQVRGGMLQRYLSLGGLVGWLGFPISDEAEAAPSRFGTLGLYNHFEHGEMDYHWTGPRRFQAFEVNGAIGHRFISMGGTGSILGFPISDEHDAPEGRQSDFEGGSLYWRRDIDKVYMLVRVLDHGYSDSPFQHGWHRYAEDPQDLTILVQAHQEDGPFERYLSLRAAGTGKAVSYSKINEMPGLDLNGRYCALTFRARESFHFYVHIGTEDGSSGYVAVLPGLKSPKIACKIEWTLPLDNALLDGAWHTIILDLEKEAVTGFQDHYVSMNWFCFRGNIDIAQILVSDHLPLLKRTVVAPVHVSYAHPLCRKGDEGDHPLRIQRFLIRYGHYSGTLSDLFDEATEKALTEFQLRKGIAADGKAGPLTWETLVKALVPDLDLNS